jgi:hypothetical protein
LAAPVNGLVRCGYWGIRKRASARSSATRDSEDGVLILRRGAWFHPHRWCILQGTQGEEWQSRLIRELSEGLSKEEAPGLISGPLWFCNVGEAERGRDHIGVVLLARARSVQLVPIGWLVERVRSPALRR